MDTNDTLPITLPNEGLLFEYDQLRKEILHNDTLTIQILGGIALLAGILMSAAFRNEVPNLWVKGFLFFLVQLIACIGVWQTVDRGRSTYVIASYLRIFVEPQVKDPQWETRLHEFRKRSVKIDTLQKYGDFINYQMLTYLFLIIINFLLGVAHAINELPLLAIFVTGNLPIVWFLITAQKRLMKYTVDYETAFDGIWKEIRDGGN
jgi:hypothetical protein